MQGYAAAIRSTIKQFGSKGFHVVMSTISSTDPKTGDARYTTPTKIPVIANVWPDAIPHIRRTNINMDLSMVLREGGRYYWAATIGSDAWKIDDQLELDSILYVVRWVGKYKSHIELLLEVVKS